MTLEIFFELSAHRDAIVQMEGFGEKSFQRLMDSLEKARHTTLPRVLYSLGISNIGLANAKVICRHFDSDIERLRRGRRGGSQRD